MHLAELVRRNNSISVLLGLGRYQSQNVDRLCNGYSRKKKSQSSHCNACVINVFGDNPMHGRVDCNVL
jgi:hypothetical protein